MPYVARASQRIEAPIRVVFDCLVDHRSWSTWMPSSFRPVGTRFERLEEGNVFRARILGSIAPTTCLVTVVKDANEVAWCGGKKNVIWAEHRFLVEPTGDNAVDVESRETWSGPVATLLRRLIQPLASKVGKDQLRALHDEALRRHRHVRPLP